MLAEQADGLRKLALGGVHAAHEHVEHEVDQLDVREPVALLLGGDERGDEVVARRGSAHGQQLVGPGVELLDRALDALAVVHQARGIELALDPVRPIVQARRVFERCAHQGSDRERGVGLGEGLDQLAAGLAGHGLEELGKELAHGRAPAVGGPRREGGVHEVA